MPHTGRLQYNYVIKETATKEAFLEVVNSDHGAPVKGLFVFSHGYQKGLNLGGPHIDPGKTRAETKQDEESRHIEQRDFRDIHPQFSKDALVRFYGCNTGKTESASIAFAQRWADAFGVHTQAPNTTTHFDPPGYAKYQVPDTGGRVLDFFPDTQARQAGIDAAKAGRSLAVAAGESARVPPIASAQQQEHQ